MARRRKRTGSGFGMIVVVVVGLAMLGRATGDDSPNSTVRPYGAATTAPGSEAELPGSGDSGASPDGSSIGGDADATGSRPVGKTERARVIRVIDGDTIVVDRGKGEERVRYIGVDAPELGSGDGSSEWMSRRATKANEDLVGGREVLLERDVSTTDRYGRLLRYVWVRDNSSASGWILVTLKLVALGVAQVATYPPDVRYVDLYLAAQTDAQTAAVGLFGTPPATDPPPEEPKPDKPAKNCLPSYEGACLKSGIGDYDCAGGSGDGPNYVAGPIYVGGSDPFDLDRDGDGVACEPY